MAASELEVSVKGVHCIPKLGSNHSKSKSKLCNNPAREFFFIKVAD